MNGKQPRLWMRLYSHFIVSKPWRAKLKGRPGDRTINKFHWTYNLHNGVGVLPEPMYFRLPLKGFACHIYKTKLSR